MSYDHILFIGFGGPEKKEEVRPFLEAVAAGRNIPEDRLKIVEQHYDAIGGFSPYNQLCKTFIQQLDFQLKSTELKIPIFLGMRTWKPQLGDVVKHIAAQNLR